MVSRYLAQTVSTRFACTHSRRKQESAQFMHAYLFQTATLKETENMENLTKTTKQTKRDILRQFQGEFNGRGRYEVSCVEPEHSKS